MWACRVGARNRAAFGAKLCAFAGSSLAACNRLRIMTAALRCAVTPATAISAITALDVLNLLGPDSYAAARIPA